MDKKLKPGCTMAELGKREKKFLKYSEAEKLRKLREASDQEKVYYLNLIHNRLSPEQADALASKANLSSLWKANRGKGGGSLPATTFKGSKGSGKVNYEEELPAETQAYKDLLLKEAQQGLPGLLEQLRTPYQSPMMQQVEDIFGHLQNPILQNLLYPDQRFAAGRSLFPSEIEQEYMQTPMQQYEPPSAISNLLSSLGKHYYETQALPWLQNKENLQWLGEEGIPQAYNQAMNYGNQAYNYAAGSRPGQGISNILGHLGNAANIGKQNVGEFAELIMGIPELAQAGRKTFGESLHNPELYGGIPARAYQGVQSGLSGLQDLYGFAKTLPGEAYNDISSVLNKLGSYLPRRNKGV
jgi:hypothetical protein